MIGCTNNYQTFNQERLNYNWDYIILTASNTKQAKIYIQEIKKRIEQNQIPSNTNYLVMEDIKGKRIGSGGATLNALKNIYDTFDCSNRIVEYVWIVE